MNEIRRKEFEEKKEIKEKGWKIEMSGRDMVGIEKNGYGKKMDYIIKEIVNIKRKNRLMRGDGNIELVLDKKRELEKKIKKVEQDFGE